MPVNDPRRQHDRIAEKFRHHTVPRLHVEIARTADLRKRAVAHHRDLVGEGQRLGLVVRDQHGGDAGAFQKLGDRLAHGCAQAGIQRRKRLVQQHQARLHRHGARQRHALLLPARKLVRPPIQDTLVQPDDIGELGDARLPSGLAPGEAETDIVGNGQMREQRTVLRHHANTAPVRRNEDAFVGESLSIEHDAPAIRRLEAGDEPQQGGLAAAGRPDDGRAAARTHVEINAGQRRDRTVAFRQTGNDESAHRPAIRFD